MHAIEAREAGRKIGLARNKPQNSEEVKHIDLFHRDVNPC